MTDTDLNPDTEIALRQHLVQVALGRAPADRLIRVGRLFDAPTGTWMQDAEVAIAGPV
jgi:adenine deaminase